MKGKRGRPSLADKILKDLDEAGGHTQSGHNESNFLVLYDFSDNPKQYFYRNLHKIMAAMDDGVRIQASIIQCTQLKTALAIDTLAKHYKAHSLVYRAELIET